MSSGGEQARERCGRRPGGPDTRSGVLDAARHEFGERGYDGATVRAIAARAGVDAALVHHYFGTKEQLFVAVMEIPFEPTWIAEQVAAAEPGELGERVARTFLQVWGDPLRRGPLLAMLRSAMTHEKAATEFQVVQFMPALVLPQFLLCGLLVPREDLPGVLEAISDVLPLSYAVDAMTEVQDRSQPEIWGYVAIIVAFALGLLVLGAVTLRRRTP